MENSCQVNDKAPELSPAQQQEQRENFPPLANLIFPRRTKLDELMAKIPKPDGYLPRIHFPNWVDMPLHHKLPVIPIDSFFYSRGKLNQPLARDFRKEYTTQDPHNVFKLAPPGPYNALHDPATERYFKRPSVRKLLLERGLVTEQGEVACTQKEFNEYRKYLEHFQTDVLLSHFRSEEEQRRANSSLERELRAYIGVSEHKVKKDFAEEKQRLMLEERNRRLKYKIKEDQAIAQRNREEIKRRWEERREDSKRLAERHRKQRVELKCTDTGEGAVRQEREARAALMGFIAKMRKDIGKSLKDSELLMLRSEFQTKQLELRKAFMDRLTYERQENQQKYTKKMEFLRAEFPMLTEKRKANERRILQIMRKFLDLWRAYVNRRKARRSDPNHQSFWDVEATAKKTVEKLEEITGHEKFDNFIMNLIKMKRDMAAQLEKERAEYENEEEAQEEG